MKVENLYEIIKKMSDSVSFIKVSYTQKRILK